MFGNKRVDKPKPRSVSNLLHEATIRNEENQGDEMKNLKSLSNWGLQGDFLFPKPTSQQERNILELEKMYGRRYYLSTAHAFYVSFGCLAYTIVCILIH